MSVNTTFMVVVLTSTVSSDQALFTSKKSCNEMVHYMEVPKRQYNAIMAVENP